MSVYLTGDIHVGMDIHKLSRQNLAKRGIILTRNDVIIVLGDFGLPFLDKEIDKMDNEYHYWMEYLSKKPCKILWVDGNHDNHVFWNKQPVTEMYGGRVQVHPLADNVIHLMRGEIYEIERKTYFAMGGATSQDKEFRTEGISWWKEENVLFSDMENAKQNLERYNYKVNALLTHTPPSYITKQLCNGYYPDTTAEYLSELSYQITFDNWYCGHLHKDANIPSEKITLLYNDVIRDFIRNKDYYNDFSFEERG